MASLMQIRPLEAVIFDLDGVITNTAHIHAQAWKNVFDEVLQQSGLLNRSQPPFDERADYEAFVDGKMRDEGIKSFLASRGITLPVGHWTDEAISTIKGVGNKKNAVFRSILEKEGVPVFPDVESCLEQLVAIGVPLAIASSSKNSAFILHSTGLNRFFSVVVDGVSIEGLRMRSKPAPDIFLEAARQLSVVPESVAVVEDAASGVEAARASGAGLVIGIDKSRGRRRLYEHGADIVQEDLAGMPSIWRSGVVALRVKKAEQRNTIPESE